MKAAPAAPVMAGIPHVLCPTSPIHLFTLLENDMIADECLYKGR